MLDNSAKSQVTFSGLLAIHIQYGVKLSVVDPHIPLVQLIDGSTKILAGNQYDNILKRNARL